MSIAYQKDSNVCVEVGDRVGEKERPILNLMKEDPRYSYAQLANILNLSEKTVYVKNKALKEKANRQSRNHQKWFLETLCF